MYIFTAVNSGERCGPWASCSLFIWPGHVGRSVAHLTQEPEVLCLILCLAIMHLHLVSPSTDSRRAVISDWQKKVHLVLVNHLGGQSLPRNSLVRLTDHLDMTIGVYHGRKRTKQQTTTTLFIQTDTEWTHSLVSVFVVQIWMEDPLHLLWLHMKGYTIREKGKQLCHFYAPPQKVIPSELLSVCPSVCPSVHPSVHPSAVEHSCPVHNFDTV